MKFSITRAFSIAHTLIRHSYERSLPVYRGYPTAQSNASFFSPAAPIYIVNGAAGNREGNGGPPSCIRGTFAWCSKSQGAQSGVIGYGRVLTPQFDL